MLFLLGNPAIALLAGGAISLALKQRPFQLAGAASRYSLQAAIVLLGLQLDLSTVLKLSASYAWLVTAHVLLTLGAGLLAGRLLAAEAPTSKLIASGTAICGGTAIATLATTVRAQPHQLALALAIVFLLNVVAVFAFPPLAHWLNLSQLQFGIWTALAIHDTSSVLAAAALYGDEALHVATTIKLGRTLWLIPLVFAFALWESSTSAAVHDGRGGAAPRIKVPVFVLSFLAAAVVGTFMNIPHNVSTTASMLSKGLLVVALFLVGTDLTREVLQRMRGRVLCLALGLWGLVVPLTLLAVLWAT